MDFIIIDYNILKNSMTEKVLNESESTNNIKNSSKDIKYKIRIVDFNTIVIDKIVTEFYTR